MKFMIKLAGIIAICALTGLMTSCPTDSNSSGSGSGGGTGIGDNSGGVKKFTLVGTWTKPDDLDLDIDKFTFQASGNFNYDAGSIGRFSGKYTYKAPDITFNIEKNEGWATLLAQRGQHKGKITENSDGSMTFSDFGDNSLFLLNGEVWAREDAGRKLEIAGLDYNGTITVAVLRNPPNPYTVVAGGIGTSVSGSATIDLKFALPDGTILPRLWNGSGDYYVNLWKGLYDDNDPDFNTKEKINFSSILTKITWDQFEEFVE